MNQSDGPSRELDEFSDDLSDEALDRALEAKGWIHGGTIFSTCRANEKE